MKLVSKFIFDGTIIKSLECFESAAEAREFSLKRRQNMYLAAYNALILEENELERSRSASTDLEDCVRVCHEPEN